MATLNGGCRQIIPYWTEIWHWKFLKGHGAIFGGTLIFLFGMDSLRKLSAVPLLFFDIHLGSVLASQCLFGIFKCFMLMTDPFYY